jgi:hypothetical protein
MFCTLLPTLYYLLNILVFVPSNYTLRAFYIFYTLIYILQCKYIFIVKVYSSNIITVVISPLFVSCMSGLMMAILL